MNIAWEVWVGAQTLKFPIFFISMLFLRCKQETEVYRFNKNNKNLEYNRWAGWLDEWFKNVFILYQVND